MKPRPRDKKVSILITGDELAQLKRFTYEMAEAFGLDRRIENYQGKRPIGLYSWDMDCLMAVIDNALKDGKHYSDKTSSEFMALDRLRYRLSDECERAFG
jgi:hypothetical protein